MSPPDRGRREAGRWLAQAAHDLSDAEFLARGGRHAPACFLCHQAAEKTVAAFLYSRGAEFVWGHALADLCSDAAALEPSFELLASAAVLLDKFYLGTRYPSGLPGGVPAEAYDSHDSEHALEIAEEVRAFVLSIIERPRA